MEYEICIFTCIGKLDWHIDKGTKCSINWVINNSKASIEYRDGRYDYTSAIT